MTKDHADNARLAREIIDLIGNRSLKDAQHALENVLSFYMSRACLSCRKEAAESLRDHLPMLLTFADSLAHAKCGPRLIA
jgi:hypothetical protein